MKEPEYVLMFGLYGIDKVSGSKNSSFWKRWFNTAVNLGMSFDLVMTHSSYGLGNMEDNWKDPKNCSLAKSSKRLLSILERNQLYMLDLYSMISNPSGYLSVEYDLNCNLIVDESGCLSYLCIDLPRFQEKFHSSLSSFLNRHVILFNDFVNAAYGFIAVMTRWDTGYPIGLSSNRSREEISYECTAWRRITRKECDETLRNVHGFNLLSEKHLQIRLGDQTLGKWIEADPSRGRLERFNERLTSWSFMCHENDYESLHYDYPPLKKVREQLKAFNIFPFQHVKT